MYMLPIIRSVSLMRLNSTITSNPLLDGSGCLPSSAYSRSLDFIRAHSVFIMKARKASSLRSLPTAENPSRAVEATASTASASSVRE